MKRYLISLVIKEIWTKTTITYHYKSTRMTDMKRTANSRCTRSGGKSAVRSWRCSTSFMVRNWGFLSTAMWVRYFGGKVFQLSQASRQPWCLLAFRLQPYEGLRAGVTQLSSSQIPDPQENWQCLPELNRGTPYNPAFNSKVHRQQKCIQIRNKRHEQGRSQQRHL